MKITLVLQASSALAPEIITTAQHYSPDCRIAVAYTNQDNFTEFNALLMSIETELTGLISSDVLLSKNWLLPIIELFKADTQIAAIQPKILTDAQSNKFASVGAAGGLLDRWAYPYFRGSNFAFQETDTGQYDTIGEIFWASRQCMIVRTAVLKQLGGFNRQLFQQFGDIDLCWRMQHAGYKIKVQPASTVYLSVPHPTQDHWHETALTLCNSLMLLARNLPKKELFTTIFIRMCFDGLYAIKLLFTKGPLYFIAVISAHFMFYKALPRVYQERKLLKPYVKTKRSQNAIALKY